MSYFIHEKAICESNRIGNESKIWAFAHILPNAQIGDYCNICDHVFIENDVIIGNRVTIKCGVQLWDGTQIEDDVFIGPNATLTNDLFPRSKHYPEKFLQTTIKRGASIGANVTLLPGITIGQYAMVGAGAVVVTSVPDYAIVAGNPAKVIGFSENTLGSPIISSLNECNNINAVNNPDNDPYSARLYPLRVMSSSRGDLTFCEFEQEIPFAVKRSFTLYNIPTNKIRGNHAHKACHQFIVCMHGSVNVMMDDGHQRRVFKLDRPHMGLLAPAKTWNTLYDFSAHAVVIIYASMHYDAADYIHHYEEFIEMVTADTAAASQKKAVITSVKI